MNTEQKICQIKDINTGKFEDVPLNYLEAYIMDAEQNRNWCIPSPNATRQEKRFIRKRTNYWNFRYFQLKNLRQECSKN
jgi:hypothetical protein